ncbi:cell division protein FtsW [Candidatus Peribacteria bacterium]|jgi:cell division protein FtsW|nr:cell division protein FtsW [Candidatus Peribacteria bacterium]MBT4021416.1 cell division protein FtsW [Candidatus Peribacteria bacterium]MBT4240432.1 cell division protein FtsW [Candidatus Peribacteria bacterium]MBT4474514.1 cell division protein FtsW [Candidatus Peribacteria bacterium]
MFHKYDTLLLGVTIGLTLFGLAMIASVSVYESFQITTQHVNQGILDEPNNSFYLIRNFWHVITGLGIMLFLATIPYRLWEKLALPLFLISLGLLVSLFIPGIGADYGTARSWISVGPISLQPSEFTKLTLILYLAVWLQKREQLIQTLEQGFFPFAILLSVTTLLVAMQPDLGSVLVIVSIAVTMFFIAGGNIVHIVVGAAASISVALPLILSKAYIRARFLAFIRPDDPSISETIGFQINQALIAVGSGRFFGQGYGKSIQKFGYLPEVQSDTIFAAMGEELGFIRMLIILTLFSTLVIRGFKAATQAPDRFGLLVAAGISTWIGFQTVINMCVNLSLLPLTGITLPLISYGGSSHWALLASIGILLNISAYSVHETVRRKKTSRVTTGIRL